MRRKLTVVGTFTSDVEAELASAVLDANGIPALLIRDNAGGMMPYLNAPHPVRLAVEIEHAETAARLLRGEDPGDGEVDETDPFDELEEEDETDLPF